MIPHGGGVTIGYLPIVSRGNEIIPGNQRRNVYVWTHRIRQYTCGHTYRGGERKTLDNCSKSHRKRRVTWCGVGFSSSSLKDPNMDKNALIGRERDDAGTAATLHQSGERRGKDVQVRFGFSAGGLLFPFYIGVCQGLQESGYLSARTRLAGASAGSLIAACVNSGLPLTTVKEKCQMLMKECRENGTRGRLGIVLEEFLKDTLPLDAHERCSGRTYIGVTQTQVSLPLRSIEGALKPVLVSQFSSRDDLISALMTSCHIPLWLDGRLTTDFRGMKHLDGGLTNFIPLPPPAPGMDEGPGVRVTCFASKRLSTVVTYDIGISPDSFEPWPYSMTQMVQWAFSPAEDELLELLIDRGREGASNWVERYEKKT